MRYPLPDGEDGDPEKEIDKLDEPTTENSHEPFKWDLDAKGELTAHITPQVEFGIKFDSEALANAALNLGVDSYTRIYADAHVGSDSDFRYCYGMDGGSTLFAKVEAP